MLNYLFIDLKIMFRIPLSVFFSIIYPILMMFIFVTSFGNVDIGNGFHFIDKYFMISIGMGLLPLTLVSFPIWLGNSFENNSIERLNYFGVKVSKIFVGDVLAHLLLAILSISINMFCAFVFYKLKFPSLGYFFAFLFQYLLAVVVLLMVGGIFALIFRNPQVLTPLGLISMFLLYMCCGTFMPIEQLPNIVQKISKYIPLKYAMNDFFEIWSENHYIDKTFITLSLIYLFLSSIILFILTRKNKKI